MHDARFILVHDILQDMEEEEDRRSPIWYIVGPLLLLMLVMSAFPYWGLKDDKWPSDVPEISDVYIGSPVAINSTGGRDFNIKMMPGDPIVKQVSTRIATFSCDSSKMCQAKSQYFFVRDNFAYVSEYDEYIQTPVEMLSTKGGDCDDHAVLLANLLQAMGVQTRFVHVPRHVYVEAYFPDAPRRYQDDGWISLDPTCKGCDFGEISWEYQN